MKNVYLILILLICSKTFSQTEVSKDEIVFENNSAFFKSTHKEFTGIINSSISKGNHPIFQKTYENGLLTKYTEYYNLEEKIVYKEVFYSIKTSEKTKELKYSSDGQKKWNIEYDFDGQKSLEEIYINKKLTYSCHYSNGKKNGTEICENKDRAQISKEYSNGKLIK